MANEKPPFEQVYAEYTQNCAKIARSYHERYHRIHDLEDLFQVATIGLWNAYQKCDDMTTFPGLAKLHIVWSVRHYCKEFNHLIRVPYTNGMLRGVAKPYQVSSLSSPISVDGDDKSLVDIIPDDQSEFEDEIANDELFMVVNDIIRHLNDKDYELVGLYLLCGGIVKLANALGVHHNTARKRLNVVLEKMRAHLELVGITPEEVCA